MRNFALCQARSAAPAALLLFCFIAAANAAPLCERPASIPHRQSFRPINSFAENQPPRAIVPGRGRCGWGIGLAMPGSGTGTAFIIGNRREVMTNLHVIDRNCSGRSRFTFSHGFDRGGALSTETATVVIRGDYCNALAEGQHDYGGDWVIAVLDRDPLSVERPADPGEAVPLRPDDGDWRQGNGRYFLLGYGMSFRRGMQPYRSAPCRFSKLFGDGAVEHSCDASPRGSGAPILIENAAGNCVVAAMHDGEIADVPGRPRYGDISANVAVLARQFAAAAQAVARKLEDGLDASQIAADLARDPPQ